MGRACRESAGARLAPAEHRVNRDHHRQVHRDPGRVSADDRGTKRDHVMPCRLAAFEEGLLLDVELRRHVRRVAFTGRGLKGAEVGAVDLYPCMIWTWRRPVATGSTASRALTASAGSVRPAGEVGAPERRVEDVGDLGEAGELLRRVVGVEEVDAEMAGPGRGVPAAPGEANDSQSPSAARCRPACPR